MISGWVADIGLHIHIRSDLSRHAGGTLDERRMKGTSGTGRVKSTATTASTLSVCAALAGRGLAIALVGQLRTGACTENPGK
jgi:hypothetical protein